MQIDDTRLKELYERGLTDLQIGLELGCSPSIVRAHRYASGILRKRGRPPKPRPPKPPKDFQIDAIRELAGQCLSDKEIGSRLGLCKTTIQRRRSLFGIPRGMLTSELVAELCKAGLTDHEIGVRFGYSVRYVAERRLGAGITRRSGGYGWLPTRQEFASWDRSGLTSVEVAESNNVRVEIVWLRRRKLGLPTALEQSQERWKASVPPMEGDLLSLFIGSMFGNGYLSARGIFGEAHCVRHEAYFRWKLGYWGSWVVGERYQTCKNSNLLEIRTAQHPEFEEWRKRLYHKTPQPGRTNKRFSLDLVDLVTPLSLAVWYQDAGRAGHFPCFYRKADPATMRTLCACLEKFGIKPLLIPNGIEVTGYRNADHFLKLIEPHIHPTMRSKLECGYRKTPRSKQRLGKKRLSRLLDSGFTQSDLVDILGVEGDRVEQALRRHGLTQG